MQKRDKQPELRALDDPSPGSESPLDRNLTADEASTEEKVRLEVRDRSQLKFKTHEPKMEEWVEPTDVSLEDEWSKAERPTSQYRKLWISVAVIVAAGIGWAAFEISELKKQKAETIADAKRLLEKEEQAERDAWQTIESMRAAAKQFYAAGSMDEMLRLVRQSERVRPMMEKYYADKTFQPVEVKRFVELSPLTIGSRGGFWVVVTELNTGELGKLIVEVKSPSEAKVDWETLVCAQPMDWEKFVKERPAGYRGDFRVYVEKDTFYNYEYADGEKYQSFKITTINSYEAIYGYAPRDGKVFQTLSQLISQTPDPKAPVILRLHLPEGYQSKNGALIEEVVAPRWLLLDDPEKAK